MAHTDLFAHSLSGPGTKGWEQLADHLQRVADRARDFADAFGAGRLALAAGLLHDIGKCSADYQDYIRGKRTSGPDHSTAGARVAVSEYGSHGRLLAFAIAGHHSGLMDGSGHTGKGRSLSERLDAVNYAIPAHGGWRGLVPELPDFGSLRIDKPLSSHADYPGFEAAFLARMIFSCLVDADFLETERFYTEAEGKPLPLRGGRVDRTHLDRIRAHMTQRRREDTPVNRLRCEVLDHAVGKAALCPGLFTLTVPTGGGKTLTSLSFALEHALNHDLRRVVYVIPFTSIIEQTANVFRDEVGLGWDVLEHHASFEWEGRQPTSGLDAEHEERDGLAKLRRDAENWDAPIVVTTAVQFFESLFGARTGRARKLHNLARSVIILDEAQTLPVRLLLPCMAVVDELARNYGTSVVLCTATQPALRKRDAALPRNPERSAAVGFDIDEDRELAPRPSALYEELKRVKIEWRPEPVPDADVVARFEDRDQMLCIVNTRAHARALFEGINHLPGGRHLTTLMCARHRRQVLARVKDDLARGQPVRLVATSLIEAGVDIDFPEVWRAVAGLDSIAQAAGRCNREGAPELGTTVVFEPAGRQTPLAMRVACQAARQVLRREGDPLSLDSLYRYFRELYFEQGYDALDAMPDPADPSGRTKYRILPEIAHTRGAFDFPFSRIARAFRLIDEVMVPVLIPWNDEAKKALQALEYAPRATAAMMRQLQQYVVPVPRAVRAAMYASGAVQAINEDAYGDRFIYLASPPLYTETHGLRLDDPTWRSSEDNIL